MNGIQKIHDTKPEDRAMDGGRVDYRPLEGSGLNPSLFASFNRYQEVKQCWRKENNGWVLKDIAFTENWSAEQIEFLVQCLRNTLRQGGAVWGAFVQEALVGFASLENEIFGASARYLQLSSIHVSHEKRGLGIGQQLFHVMCQEAQKRGANKLYISAHSSKETQAFYRSLKCTEAQEYNLALATAEPCDCQMEFDLTK